MGSTTKATLLLLGFGVLILGVGALFSGTAALVEATKKELETIEQMDEENTSESKDIVCGCVGSESGICTLCHLCGGPYGHKGDCKEIVRVVCW